MRWLAVIIFTLTFTNFTFADEEIDQIFSFDLGYTLLGFKNNGIGLGCSFEKKIIDHLSIRGNFGHMTFPIDNDKNYCTTVNIAADVYYYLLSKDLNMLYLGIGNGTDFLNYFGHSISSDNKDDEIIYISSRIGWKWYVVKHVLIDISAGYNIVIDKSRYNIPLNRNGLQNNIMLKIFL